MEVKSLIRQISAFLIKYRYVACVLLVGVVLMLLPSGTAADSQHNESVPSETPTASAAGELSTLLSKIQGAGKVEVMLSYARGAETRYHSDTETETDASHHTTVIVTDGNRNESALISRVDPPEYLGAIVLCQGADSAAVRLAIVEAVSKYTGLGADQIAVLKMK